MANETLNLQVHSGRKHAWALVNGQVLRDEGGAIGMLDRANMLPVDEEEDEPSYAA